MNATACAGFKIMDIDTFDRCFKQWLAYKGKRKDWPQLRDVYFQELGKHTEVQLKEALGRLLTKNNYFPDIAEISNELRSNKKSDGQNQGSSAKRTELINDNVLLADRLLDYKLGLGKMPEDAPFWMDDFVTEAINRFHGGERENYLRGTLGKWITDETVRTYAQ